MQQRGFGYIAVVLILLALFVAGGIWYYENQTHSVQVQSNSESGVVVPLSTTTASNSTATDLLPQSGSATQREFPVVFSGPGVAPNGFQYASELRYSSSTYEISYVTSTCDDVPDAGCDATLTETNDSTGQVTTLIPSLWKALPALQSLIYGKSDLLYSDGANLYMQVSDGTAIINTVGFFAFNMQTGQIQKLNYSGDPSCPTLSPDNHYVLSADTDDPANGVSGSEWKVEVFSLSGNSNVYTNLIVEPQTLDDSNVDESEPGCGPVGNWSPWIATDTMSYAIYNDSQPNADGTFPVAKQVTMIFPS